MKAEAILAALALLGAAPAGPAFAWNDPGAAPDDPDALRAVPADQIFDHWVHYNALDAAERDLFTLDYRMNVDGGGDGALWRRSEGGWVRLGPDGEGGVSPPDPDWIEDGGQVFTDAPPGAARIQMIVRPDLAPAREIDAAALRGALVQANEAIRRRAGIMALFTPDFDAAVFEFGETAPDGWAVFEDGRREPLEAVETRLIYTPRARGMRGAARIELGAVPVSIALSAE